MTKPLRSRPDPLRQRPDPGGLKGAVAFGLGLKGSGLVSEV